MGTSARRKKEFYARHPICCFCGGGTSAETQDHIPSRSLFRQRQWPEGYVFPACSPCNSLKAPDEALTALICRIASHDSGDAESQREVQRLMKTIALKEPELYRSFQLPATRVRRWLRVNNYKLPQGATTADVPVISIQHPKIIAAMERYSTKIFLSLYYFHTGNVLPSQGGIVFRWYSNASRPDERPPQELLEPMMQGFPTLVRQQTSLHEQFFYSFGVSNDGSDAAVFHVFFNNAIALLGFIFADMARVKTPENAIVLKPFSHE